MCYKNGKDLLPEALLKELQKYVQGELIYIPKNESRKAWGEGNGARRAIRERNLEIYKRYEDGIKIPKLSNEYNLSEDSIRKIVFKMNKEILNRTCI